MTRPVQAVLFDFGRVISAPKPLSLFEGYEDDLRLPRGSLNRIMFDDPAWDETLIGQRSLDAYWAHIGSRLGLHDPEAVRAFRARYDGDERPNEPVIALIRRLEGLVPLAVISNAPAGLRSWLARWEILDLFHEVFCSAEEGVKKPDGEAYRRVLRRLAVDPRHALFVDDAPENVEAARRVGLVSHLYQDPEALRRFLQEHGLPA